MAPSGPTASSAGTPSVLLIMYSVMAPEGVIRSMADVPGSATQTSPSGPRTIPSGSGLDRAVVLSDGSSIMLTAPDMVISPRHRVDPERLSSPKSSYMVNHMFPFGPAMISHGDPLQ